MDKLEHVHVKSSTPSQISLLLARTLPSRERHSAAAPGVKHICGGEGGKATPAKVITGWAL